MTQSRSFPFQAETPVTEMQGWEEVEWKERQKEEKEKGEEGREEQREQSAEKRRKECRKRQVLKSAQNKFIA